MPAVERCELSRDRLRLCCIREGFSETSIAPSRAGEGHSGHQPASPAWRMRIRDVRVGEQTAGHCDTRILLTDIRVPTRPSHLRRTGTTRQDDRFGVFAPASAEFIEAYLGGFFSHSTLSFTFSIVFRGFGTAN